MLINLTDLPSAKWSNKQKQAAEDEFGKIVDFTFPKINPNATAEQVNTLAKQYFEKIRKEFGKYGVISQSNCAIHIKGEFTFCFPLINLLLHKNYRCVESIMEYIITEENNFKKDAQPQFVQFRDFM
jgi:hypothetical protein